MTQILHGRWQDMLGKLSDHCFDGVFFDTYGETYSEMSDFHQHLPRLLRPGACYSYFNGLCPDNIIFHGVYCQVSTPPDPCRKHSQCKPNRSDLK